MCGIGKVLIVTPFFKPNIGGAETFAEDLAKTLSEKYIVHVCTVKWKTHILWRGMSFRKSFHIIRRMFLPLINLKRKYKYDKIFALGLISTFLCALLRMKFSAVILALYDFKSPNIYTSFLNKAQKIFVEGFAGYNEMLHIGIKKEKLVRFAHWCDQEKFFWKERNNKNLKVLFVGRPLLLKGKYIIEECQKITEGIDYEYVENVPIQELPKYYQKSDVCVVPSLYSEGFSRVVVEAASCGCAIITSNKGALPELVKDFGKAIEPTPVNFKNLLEKLNKNRDGLERLKLNTLVYAKKNFNEKNAEVFYK